MENPSHFSDLAGVFGEGVVVGRAEQKSLSRPKSFWEGGGPEVVTTFVAEDGPPKMVPEDGKS